MNVLILYILSFLIGILLFKLLYNCECFINISNDLTLITEKLCDDTPTPITTSFVEKIQELFKSNHIDTTQKLINKMFSVNENNVNSVYKLDKFFEGFKKFPKLHIENDIQAAVIISGMLGNFMHESDNFATIDEYGNPQGELCGIKYDPEKEPWSEDPKKHGNTLKKGDLMPCSCGQHDNYMTSLYIGDLYCNIPWNVSITGSTKDDYQFPMKCEPNSKSAGCCFWGRGATQITGQHNYKLFENYINENNVDGDNVNFCNNPDKVIEEEYIWLSSIWFWYTEVQEGTSSGEIDRKNNYINTLKEYSELVEQKNASATDVQYLIKNTSFFAGVSNSINRGKWSLDNAEKIATIICNSIKILQLIGMLEKKTLDCSDDVPDLVPVPENDNCCGTWDEKCMKVDNNDVCKENNNIKCVSGGGDYKACKNYREWQCEKCT